MYCFINWIVLLSLLYHHILTPINTIHLWSCIWGVENIINSNKIIIGFYQFPTAKVDLATIFRGILCCYSILCFVCSTCSPRSTTFTIRSSGSTGWSHWSWVAAITPEVSLIIGGRRHWRCAACSEGQRHSTDWVWNWNWGWSCTDSLSSAWLWSPMSCSDSILWISFWQSAPNPWSYQHFASAQRWP